MEGSNAAVYLTNPAENEVWLKLRVPDESGSRIVVRLPHHFNEYSDYFSDSASSFKASLRLKLALPFSS